jgi:hypothetical protein
MFETITFTELHNVDPCWSLNPASSDTDVGMYSEELDRPAKLDLQDLSLCGISSKTLPSLMKGCAVASSGNCLTVLYKWFK